MENKMTVFDETGIVKMDKRMLELSKSVNEMIEKRLREILEGKDPLLDMVEKSIELNGKI